MKKHTEVDRPAQKMIPHDINDPTLQDFLVAKEHGCMHEEEASDQGALWHDTNDPKPAGVIRR